MAFGPGFLISANPKMPDGVTHPERADHLRAGTSLLRKMTTAHSEPVTGPPPSRGMSTWHRKPAIERSALWWLVVVSLVIVTWPVATVAPRAGLDYSWQAALHLAVTRGLDWGTDLVFTYGPLGFLDVPQLWATPTFLLALLYVGAVSLVFCATVFSLLRRRLGVVPTLVLSWFAAMLARTVEPAELVVVLLFILSLAALQGVISARAARYLVWITPFITAVQLLVKFNTGVACALILAVTAWNLPPRRARGVALAVGSGGLALAVLWLAAGQRPGAFPLYLTRSLAVASGYSAAMATEFRENLWHYPVTAFLVVAAGMLLWRLGLSRSRWATLCLVVPFAYLEAKHAFVRHDITHGQSMFLALALLPLAVSWKVGLWRGGVVLAAAASLTMVLSQLYSGLELFQPVRPARRAAAQAQDVLSGARRHRLLEASRRQMLADLGFEGFPTDSLRGHAVHVDPLGVDAAWLLGVRWRPVPVFQSYVAFTPDLDRLNARALLSADGPDRILRPRNPPGVDGRNPLFESPEYMLNLICHFQEVAGSLHLQVLARTENRCGPAVRLASLQATEGQYVDVPQAGPGELIFARIRLPAPSAFDSLTTVMFKPIGHPVLATDPQTAFRLVRATAGGPLVMSLPHGADILGSLRDLDTQRIAVDGANGPVTVDFFVMRYEAVTR